MNSLSTGIRSSIPTRFRQLFHSSKPITLNKSFRSKMNQAWKPTKLNKKMERNKQNNWNTKQSNNNPNQSIRSKENDSNQQRNNRSRVSQSNHGAVQSADNSNVTASNQLSHIAGRLFLGIPVPISQSASLHSSLVHPDAASRLHLPPKSKLIPPANWHMTLCFIGETDHEQAEKLIACLCSIPLTALPNRFQMELNHFGSFPKATKARVLYFGSSEELSKNQHSSAANTNRNNNNRNDALAFSPVAALRSLAREIHSTLKLNGFSIDHKAFEPHITLTRYRTPQNITEWMKAQEGRGQRSDATSEAKLDSNEASTSEGAENASSGSPRLAESHSPSHIEPITLTLDIDRFVLYRSHLQRSGPPVYECLREFFLPSSTADSGIQLESSPPQSSTLS